MLKVLQKSRKLLICAAVLVLGLGLAMPSGHAYANSPEVAEEEPELIFPVISDTQITNDFDLQRFDSALEQLNRIAPRQDALVFPGDLVDNGYEYQYDGAMEIFDKHIQPETELLIGIGNHEYANESSAAESQERFIEKTGMESLYYHKVIRDYNFIVLGEDDGYFYSKEQIRWLGEQLQEAEQRDPEKPIFVFMHHGLKDTTYGTDTWYFEENNDFLYDTLAEYPQVILFHGHLHYPISDPRSIYQKDFTIVNTGAVRYMWTERGYLQGELPPGHNDVSNGLIVEVYDDEIVINRRGFHANGWVGDPWVVEQPVDSSTFEYNDDRDKEAPYFQEDATVSNLQEQTTTSDLNIQFDQAVDNLLVHSYRVTAENQDTGEVESDYLAFSEYYRAVLPDPLTLPITGLQPDTAYNIRVQAIDAFDNRSESVLQTIGKTNAVQAVDLKALVAQYADDGEIEATNTARHLTTHLTAVERFESQGKNDRVIKHMEGFQLLLEYQKENELISEKAYNDLEANASSMIKSMQQ